MTDRCGDLWCADGAAEDILHTVAWRQAEVIEMSAKRMLVVRVSPELYDEVVIYADNVSRAVEEALVIWVKRARRRPRAVSTVTPDARTVGGRSRRQQASSGVHRPGRTPAPDGR
jgi:hypothetical protein